MTDFYDRTGDRSGRRVKRWWRHARHIAARARSTFAARGARRWLHAEVSLGLPALPLSRTPVDVAVTVGGEPVGKVSLRPGLSADQLRLAIVSEVGPELAVAAVRESLLGRPFDDLTPLRERLAGRARGASFRAVRRDDFDFGPGSFDVLRVASGMGGIVLGRRRGAIGRSSASRRAILPCLDREVLGGAASVAGEPTLDVRGSAPRAECAVYAPSLLWRSPRLRKQPAARARGRRRDVSIGGGHARTARLPILMYHRIGEHRSEPFDRYCVTPGAFAAQLEHLEASGFTSATLDEWFDALASQTPLAGRRVAITFDDGYADFLSTGWPLLQRHRYSATMFVVTDRVGMDNAWDNVDARDRRQRREPVPLLTWDELAGLHEEGLELGGHSRSHRYLTTLTPAEVVDEVAGSRAALTATVGCLPRAFAYPYGDVDGVTRHLVGACGFELGLTCRPGPSAVWEDPLDLSRIEVSGHDDLAAFAAKLEARS
jgi:peptidoglycan/xylan/chitin deacetylase (PgdA/CDA1 family)